MPRLKAVCGTTGTANSLTPIVEQVTSPATFTRALYAGRRLSHQMTTAQLDGAGSDGPPDLPHKFVTGRMPAKI
jgi:hypothetical protein